MKFLAVLSLLPLLASGLSFYDPTDPDKLLDHQWCCQDAECAPSCARWEQLDPANYDPDGPVVGLPANLGSLPFPFYETYSAFEVYLNTDGSGERFCEHLFGYVCKPDCCALKDPHFKTWEGKWYDFHGECDMVFLNAPNFAKGLGLDIQIRTKKQYQYSYIETAAMKIGDDILEVSSYGTYSLNGIQNADLADAKLGSFDIEYKYIDEKSQSFDIITDNEQVIQIKTFKDFVDVKLEKVNMHDFKDSMGMMGVYPFGNLTARDGVTLIDDPNEVGQEWQVLPEEESLFSTVRAPQSKDGQKCIMPDPTKSASVGRRLGEGVSREQAEKACVHLEDEQRRDMCVYDVVATGDLELASAGAY